MHRHHLVPRHRDPSSEVTVEVTVTQHAMFHFCEWRLHGRQEDLVAWKGLAKQIGKEELFKERSRMGGQNNKGKPKSAEHSRKIAEANSKPRAPLAEEHKANISESMQGNTNSHCMKTEEARKRHSEIMKEVWRKRRGALV